MSRLTLLVLLVFVGALGFLAWRQTRLDASHQAENDVLLFAGFDAASVRAVRIDNSVRMLQMRFERDPRGGWNMVDPMSVRAESGMIDALVASAVQRRGTPVPESEAHDLAKLGLEPARIVFSLTLQDGRTKTIQVGALDLDRNRVHVQVDGQVLRAMRDFDNLLGLQLDEYQSHSATSLDPRDVVEFHRRGMMRFPDTTAEVDVTLDALFDDGEWRATSPVRALLDPLTMTLIAQTSAGLRFEHIVPTGGAALSSLGLDPPALEIAIRTAHGESAKILFGPADPLRPDNWNGTVAGDPVVWRVGSDLPMGLATRIDELFDHSFVRAPRAELERIRLSSQTAEVQLVQSPAGWGVSEAHPGSEVFAPMLLADTRRVEDFLGRLESSSVRTFQRDAPQLAASEVRERIRIETKAGRILVGSFGADHETGGVRFQREGDDVVGIVDETFRALARTSAQSFWSTTILETAEIAVVRLTISQGDRERVFERDRAGVWVEQGRTGEAKQLHPLLDPLLFLRAKSHLTSLAPNIEGPIRVRWTLSGAEHTLLFGRIPLDGEPTAVCDFEGRRSILERPDLVDGLAHLLTP